MALTIETVASADALTSRDLDQVVRIHNRCWAELCVGEPPVTAAAYLDIERFTHPPEVVVSRLVRNDAGVVVGIGQASWREGEPGTAGVQIFVSPDARHQGVGTALGAELASVSKEAGRTGVTVQPVHDSTIAPVLERAGFRADLVVEQNRAAVAEASDEMLAGWVSDGEAAGGYSLVTYDAPCPDDLVAGFADARHVMNDAPRWEDEAPATFTAAELRAADAAAAASRFAWWNVGVRHDATGAIVGLSEMYLPVGQPWIAYQGDTGVAAEHRGHGLGAWMKAINHLRLRTERPNVEVIQTWNASANAPMLRINRALGFRPVQTYRGWYKPLG